MFHVLVETSRGTKVADIFCSNDICSIGKANDNLVTIHGWNVERVHARLQRQEAGVFIYDLGSKIGTKVNGHKIKQYGPLEDGDVIQIHDYKIKVKANKTSALPHEGAADVARRTAAAAAGARAPAAASDKPDAQEPRTTAVAVQSGDFNDAVMREWRMILRERLIAQMDLRRINVNSMSDDDLRQLTSRLVHEIILTLDDLPENMDRDVLAEQVVAESVGLGPLEALIGRDDISEIMVNSAQEIFYEEKGKLRRSSVAFTDDKAVIAAIERIVTPLGRRIDESSPMVDARLRDGSRVNAVIPPLALKGPCITIRKFMKERLTAQHLIGFGSISAEMVEFLEVSVFHKRNVVISGGTGSGKTTLLNVLSNFIPKHERVITVEDAAELRLNQLNLVSLEARPANQEGKGAVHIRDLVRNCLRMRPDRIVVGECRGGEALDMLQAMNTGHDGSLTTAHANTPRDCISRLEVMVMMAGMELPILAVREQISSAVQLIVQQTRFSCGTRKVTSICELSGIENNRIQLSEIFRFQQTGYDADGKTQGKFMPTGLVPEFYESLHRRGINVNLDIFKVPER